MGNGGAQKDFAVAGGRDGAGTVIRVGARADDRRVANTLKAFARHAAGGSGRGQAAPAVHRHRSDRADMRNGVSGELGVAAANSLQLRKAFRRVEVALRHEFKPLGGGEFLGAGAGQHHMVRSFHDGPRKFHGISNARDAAYGARLQRAAIHDGGIQFVAAVEREHGAAPGIEQGIVLERYDRPGHRVEAGAAAMQDRIARIDRLLESGAIPALRLVRHVRAR